MYHTNIPVNVIFGGLNSILLRFREQLFLSFYVLFHLSCLHLITAINVSIGTSTILEM